MTQVLACPHCQMKFRVAENSPPRVRCPHCRGVVALATASAEPTAASPVIESTFGVLNAESVESPSAVTPAPVRYRRSWALLFLALLLGVGIPALIASQPYWGGDEPDRNWLLYGAAGGAVLALINLLIAAARKAPRLVRFVGILCLSVPVYGLLALFLLTMSGHVSLAAIGVDDWHREGPPDGHCTMLMPGLPRHAELIVEGAPAPMQLLRSELKAKGQTFEIGALVLPEPITLKNTQTWLDRLKNAIVARSQGQLRRSLPRFINYLPGFELDIQMPDGRVQLVRGALGRQRVFLLGMTAPDLTMNTPEVQKFWSSFSIGEDEKGTELMEFKSLPLPGLGGGQPPPGAGRPQPTAPGGSTPAGRPTAPTGRSGGRQ